MGWRRDPVQSEVDRHLAIDVPRVAYDVIDDADASRRAHELVEPRIAGRLHDRGLSLLFEDLGAVLE
jgi:hypothetical protein